MIGVINMRKIMASLDIGSGSMKLVVGELYRNRLNVLVSLTEELKGFKDGLLVNEDKFIDVIKKIMEKASEIVGIKIKQMIITIPPRDLEFSVITGKIKVNSEEGIVAGIDVSKVFKESLKGQIPKDREFVSYLPKSDEDRIESVEHPLAQTFADSKTVAEYKVSGFATQQIKRYTIVIWLDGNDPQSNPELEYPEGATLKLGVDIAAHENTKS